VKAEVQVLSFSVRIKQVVYHRDICLTHSGDYVEKQMVCLLFFIFVDVYVEVKNMTVTCLKKVTYRMPFILFMIFIGNA
jgi:hypothetical protein